MVSPDGGKLLLWRDGGGGGGLPKGSRSQGEAATMETRGGLTR